jgi:hypothetical protein
MRFRKIHRSLFVGGSNLVSAYDLRRTLHTQNEFCYAAKIPAASPGLLGDKTGGDSDIAAARGIKPYFVNAIDKFHAPLVQGPKEDPASRRRSKVDPGYRPGT